VLELIVRDAVGQVIDAGLAGADSMKFGLGREVRRRSAVTRDLRRSGR